MYHLIWFFHLRMKMELDRLLETFKVSSNIFGISSFVDMLFDLDHKSECSRNYEKRNSAEMQKISIKRLYRKNVNTNPSLCLRDRNSMQWCG